MTIGVFSPTIVFPASDQLNLTPDDYKYILKHEFLHIRNRDLLIKFMTLFALVIHWYNPICYLLYHELCVVSEMDCDYGVIQDTNDIQRQQYSHLIIDLAVVGSSRKERFAVGLVNNDAATFERRILEMKKTRKTAKPFLSCLVMALICIMGTVTAFAYETPVKIETEKSWTKFDTAFFSEHKPDVEEHIPYDYFFTDKNGNITSLENVSPRLFCKHDFVEGYATKHKKNSDGSCIVRVNECVRCSVCGYIKEGALVSEHKYTVCPH